MNLTDGSMLGPSTFLDRFPDPSEMFSKDFGGFLNHSNFMQSMFSIPKEDQEWFKKDK